ncbi:L-rhamnose/proton symporter RhaT [Chitinophaga sp. MM2321]|uniref:L-rhamnose/proton symporter RhaT n=1 Tax=Chitinophaga sp. MM2321 TaxID=3137178 RepID=UPI0032D57CC1
MEILLGLVLVVLAGLGTGTVAWPMKKINELHFEQYLFVFMLSAIIVYPWLVVLIKVPDLVQLVKTVGLKPLLISNLLSISWGVANVLYLVCVVRIGAALTGAILSAAGMSIGVIIPMLFKGSGLFSNAPNIFSPAGVVILVGLVVIIIGISLVSVAGFGREKILKQESDASKKQQGSGSFVKGLILVIIAGFLSSGISLAFVYSQGPVIAAAKQQGAGDITANFSVWALCMFGGGLVNVLYAVYLMTKKNTWHLLFARKDEIVYGSIIGLQFILSIILLGKGMLLLGALGASVGFAIQQSLQVIGNQLVGFIGGEWKAIKGRPRNTMYLAIATILVAVIILAFSNTM